MNDHFDPPISRAEIEEIIEEEAQFRRDRDMTGPQFRDLRHQMKISAQVLANRMGVHERTIYKWERGERKIPPIAIELLAILVHESTYR